MSKLEVDKIDPQSGTNLELGTSGDTVTIPTGVTLDASNATTTLPSNIVTTDGSQTLTNKSIAATQLTGTVATSNLGTGTADATTFLRGDQTYASATPAAGSITTSQLAYNPNSFRNIIINGDMSIAQRGTSTSSITSYGYYTVDRFQLAPNTMGTWTMSQSTDVPTGQGFSNSLKIDCTTADASPSAGDNLTISSNFEGQMLQYLKKGTSNAESLTLSFWVKTNKTGTYIAELYDNDNTRTINKSFTVSSADTWEKKTITYAGDTTGAFGDDNGNSLGVNFWLGAGSNFTSGTLQTSWGSRVQANRAVGVTNLADNTANELYLTGVQLEVGTSASDFEFLPFDINLQRCQRYYYAHATGGQVVGLMWWYQSGVNNTVIHFPIEMRSAPSVSTTSGTNYYRVLSNGSATDFNSLSGLQDSSAHATTIDSGLSGTGSQVGRLKCNNDGRVLFSSEL